MRGVLRLREGMGDGAAVDGVVESFLVDRVMRCAGDEVGVFSKPYC